MSESTPPEVEPDPTPEPEPVPTPDPAPTPDPVPDEDGLYPPYVTSALLRAVRAADGDDAFVGRVRAACWQVGVEYTPTIAQRVALDPAVNEAIRVDRYGTVSTIHVTDEHIIAAVLALLDASPHAQGGDADGPEDLPST